MFGKDKVSRDGAQAQALVLEKRVYATEVESGRASACRYQLRVRFEDGSTAEISRRVFGHTLAAAAVGDLIPVRYDPADRSTVEIDRHAIVDQQKTTARELTAEAVARGERALDQSLAEPVPVIPGSDRPADTGGLRIGDTDRDLIAEVLSRHMTEGRLTVDELDERLGVLYESQTRAQATSVLAGLPALAPADRVPSSPDGEQHEAMPVLPEWLRAQPVVSAAPASRQAPTQGGRPIAGGLPTDEEMTAAYEAWRAKVTKAKADKAAHKRVEAGGDRKETFLAFRRLTISRAEEKSARAKFEALRKRRPDWQHEGAS